MAFSNLLDGDERRDQKVKIAYLKIPIGNLRGPLLMLCVTCRELHWNRVVVKENEAEKDYNRIWYGR